MRLTPEDPPGRTSRKARAFTAEIGRLHADGYTSEAIRQALSKEGVHVSTTTVRREVARYAKPRQANTSLPISMPLEGLPRSPSPSEPNLHASPLGRPSGREVAEAFFNAHPSNPLFRDKEIP